MKRAKSRWTLAIMLVASLYIQGCQDELVVQETKNDVPLVNFTPDAEFDDTVVGEKWVPKIFFFSRKDMNAYETERESERAVISCKEYTMSNYGSLYKSVILNCLKYLSSESENAYGIRWVVIEGQE